MKVQDAYAFADDMEAMADAMAKLVPEALKKCEPKIIENIIENFSQQSTPDGIAWPERKKIGDGHPLFVETQTEGSGSLFGAATGQAGGHVSRVEGNTLLVGVDKSGGIGGIPGAGVHNYGNPEKNIPQREFLAISEATEDECAELILEHCAQALE